jgi:hypothetical protein
MYFMSQKPMVLFLLTRNASATRRMTSSNIVVSSAAYVGGFDLFCAWPAGRWTTLATSKLPFSNLATPSCGAIA